MAAHVERSFETFLSGLGRGSTDGHDGAEMQPTHYRQLDGAIERQLPDAGNHGSRSLRSHADNNIDRGFDAPDFAAAEQVQAGRAFQDRRDDAAASDAESRTGGTQCLNS